ncbi:MAG: SUF system Fe-S cluster assembly regulator [Myxococcota bacterium]
MFRLSKLTDYGIVILAHLAHLHREEEAAGEAQAHNARELAEATSLPVPVVSKVLKSLARHGVLEGLRGSKGGYRLPRRPEEISVADMVAALEGPVAMTECAASATLCEHEHSCAVKGPWQVINRVVQGALEGVTLADLIDPEFQNAGGALHLLQVASSGGRDNPARP